MSQRLLKHQKEQLVKNVLADAFDARQAELDRREAELARRARQEIMGARLLDIYLKLPDWAVRMRARIRVNVQGEVHWVRGGEDFRHPDKRLDQPSAELAIDVARWANDADQLLDERQELRAKSWAVVNSVTTAKKLLEVWPEAEPYLPKAAEVPQQALVDVSQVNRLIQQAKGS